MNETTVTVVGRVATDVVLRHTKDGQPFAGFGVVSTERRFDKNTESWSDANKFFVWVTGWRRLGRGAAASLKKGDPVIVNGRLQVEEVEKDGEKRTFVKVDAVAIGPNLAFCTADAQRNGAEEVGTFLRSVDLNYLDDESTPPPVSAVAV